MGCVCNGGTEKTWCVCICWNVLYGVLVFTRVEWEQKPLAMRISSLNNCVSLIIIKFLFLYEIELRATSLFRKVQRSTRMRRLEYVYNNIFFHTKQQLKLYFLSANDLKIENGLILREKDWKLRGLWFKFQNFFAASVFVAYFTKMLFFALSRRVSKACKRYWKLYPT